MEEMDKLCCDEVRTYIVASLDFAFAYKIFSSGKDPSYVESIETNLKIPTQTVLEGKRCYVHIGGVKRLCVIFPWEGKLLGIPLISKNGYNTLVRELEEREVLEILEMNQVQSFTALPDVLACYGNSEEISFADLLAQAHIVLEDGRSTTVAAHSVARSEARSEAPSASAALSAVAPSDTAVALSAAPSVARSDVAPSSATAVSTACPEIVNGGICKGGVHCISVQTLVKLRQ